MNFIVPLVIYPFDVMFSFGQSDKKLKRILKKYKVKTKDPSWRTDKVTCDGMTWMFPKGQILVRLRRVPKKNVDYGTLQHEIFHAVEFLFERVSIPHNSSEAFAYLIGYITTEVYNKIKFVNK